MTISIRGARVIDPASGLDQVGDLHIEATAMTQISIYNAMGQMVYNQNVNTDEMVIDMSQFEAGVYMVNIITENGSAVKRITVVK